MRLVNHMDTARRFIGLRELPGAAHEPFIQWAHSLCGEGPDTPDEVPWCSAFVNAVAYIHGLARSKSPAARSWLKVGYGVSASEAKPGDVVVIKRGEGPQPGPEVIAAQGHVGFLVSFTDGGRFLMLGGNQGDQVSVASFDADRILGIREIA